jgi:hypothetical protein
MNPTKHGETRRPKGVVTLWPQEVTIGNEKQPSILQVYNLAKNELLLACCLISIIPILKAIWGQLQIYL